MNEQICVTCGSLFVAKRRRSWCSDVCYRRGRQRIKERLGKQAAVEVGRKYQRKRIDEREDKASVDQWYKAKEAERQAAVRESEQNDGKSL